MNDVKKMLASYFDTEDINKLFKDLDNKKRNTVMNDNYFAKISVRENTLFCDKFINEINLYNKNKTIDNFPKIANSLINKKYCLLILHRINSKTIGNNRNDFNVKLGKKNRILIIENILKIKNIKVNFELDNSYSREEKLNDYFLKSKKYISKYTQNKIEKYRKSICKEKYERVLSHGDLICTNIMLDDNKVYFLDWEYVSLKPRYYDLAYFLLFNKTNNTFDILNNSDLDIKEIYKDGIILCLKEIQNNAKLYGIIDDKIVNKNIERWKRELNRILRCL